MLILMENPDRPYISVIIMAYQRLRFGKDPINSVISCKIPRKTYEIVLLLMDPEKYSEADFGDCDQVVLLSGRSFGDCVSESIARCRGEIICFLDDDDLFLAEKMESVMRHFSSDMNLGYLHNRFIHTGTSIIGEGNTHHEERELSATDRSFRKIAVREQYLNNSSWSVRKSEILGKISMVQRTHLSLDMVLFALAVSSEMKFVHTCEALTVFRKHKHSRNSCPWNVSRESCAPLSADCMEIYEYAASPQCKGFCKGLAEWALTKRISSSLMYGDLPFAEFISVLRRFSRTETHNYRIGIVWRSFLYILLFPGIFWRFFLQLNILVHLSGDQR